MILTYDLAEAVPQIVIASLPHLNIVNDTENWLKLG